MKIITKLLLFITLPFSCTLWAENSVSEEKVLFIYQDADLSIHSESSNAIQKGIEVAFNEIDNQIAGYKIAFKYLDHRGNVVRSKRNYQTFINDPKALVIYSGIHSPPLIKNRTFINENKALTLVPWAAGGPITRYPSKENWVFRLSVDDTRAGPVIIDYAINSQKCKAPHLLLEETPWGDSNLRSMSSALKKYNLNKPKVTRFGWNLKAKGAGLVLDEIKQAGSDCVVMVSNAVEGTVIVNEMLNLPKNERLPIVSHWGLVSGNFHEVINHEQRSELDLHFIQSCFAFTDETQTPLAKKVFSLLVKHSLGEIKTPIDLKSPVGFIHAYDLTKLLIQAIEQSGLTGNITQDRNAIRLALENLNAPINGLVKTYNKPFSIFDEKQNTNAHEALSKEDFCMASFGKNNEILLSHE
jgi:branched-chain amino acid transport system substrate-binding protein